MPASGMHIVLLSHFILHACFFQHVAWVWVDGWISSGWVVSGFRDSRGWALRKIRWFSLCVYVCVCVCRGVSVLREIRWFRV